MGLTSKLRGGDKLKAYLESVAEKFDHPIQLRVGFLSNATYPDGTPVAMIAAIQEFGAPKVGIPPRPFFRNMIAKHEADWPAGFATQLRATNYDVRLTFDRAGQAIAGQLRQSIIDTNDPPLSPVTLLLRSRFWSNPDDITFGDVQQARRDVASGMKGSVTATQSKPLVWTGHLLNSVDYEVVEGSAT